MPVQKGLLLCQVAAFEGVTCCSSLHICKPHHNSMLLHGACREARGIKAGVRVPAGIPDPLYGRKLLMQLTSLRHCYLRKITSFHRHILVPAYSAPCVLTCQSAATGSQSMMRHIMQTGGPAAAQAIAAAVAGGAPQADVEGIIHQNGILFMQSKKQAAHVCSGFLDRAVKA